MQEINFAVLEGCKPNELLPRLGLVVQFLMKEKPDLKGLKRFFKEHDFFDKERFEIVLKFLDIDYSDEKRIKPGEFITKLSKIIDPEDRKRHLFKHLTAKNEILMKYIMDALAERLHSTNEMYRYITSYVYPGYQPTLVDFRAWVMWLEASEVIKTVGIRWGLSDLGKEMMDKIVKLIDVDDLLDEEADDDDDDDDDNDAADDDDDDDDADDDDDDDDADTATPSDAKTTSTVTKAAASPASDHAPQVKPPAQTASAPVATAPVAAPTAAVPMMVPMMMESPVSSTAHVEVIVTPVKPKFDETPLELVREAFAEADEEEEENDDGEMESAPKVRIEQFRLDEEMIANNVNAIQTWWRMRPGGRLLQSSDYGFSADAFEEDAAYGLFRLSALALQLFRYGGRLNTSRGGPSFALLDQMGLYSNLMRSKKGVDKIVSELIEGGLGGRAEDLGNLHWLLIIRRSLAKLGDKGVRELFAKETMQDVVSGLWMSIGLGQLTYEILWIARELVALGLVTCADATTLGVVPLPKVRETAFRLGLIESPYAADFAHLVSISRRLTKFFGAGDAFEAPLVYFEPKRELRYDASEPAYFTRDQLGID